MSWGWIMLVVAAVSVQGAAGAWMIARGLRGRRQGAGAACARCGFDLGQRPCGRCPECGCDLSQVWAWAGARRRRPELIAAGLLMFVSLAITAGYWGLRLGARFKLQWATMESVLVRQAHEGDAGAVTELARRLELGQVSDNHLRELLDEGLERQGERTGGRWAPAWGELIETAWGKGRVPQDAWERYCRQAFPVTPEYFSTTNKAGEREGMMGARVGPTRIGGTAWAPWPRLRVVGYTLPGQEPVALREEFWGSIRGGASSMARIVLEKIDGGGSSARVRLRLEAMDFKDQRVTSWEVEEDCGVGPMR